LYPEGPLEVHTILYALTIRLDGRFVLKNAFCITILYTY
jgi:hypothetical protein